MARARQPADLAAPRLTLRVDLASGARIGPGKVALLEAIARAGSISAAGRDLGMSYRRAWRLVEEMQTSLGTRVVHTETGGSGGGGAKLTEAGAAIVAHYRAIEAAVAKHAAADLAALAALKDPSLSSL